MVDMGLNEVVAGGGASATTILVALAVKYFADKKKADGCSSESDIEKMGKTIADAIKEGNAAIVQAQKETTAAIGGIKEDLGDTNLRISKDIAESADKVIAKVEDRTKVAIDVGYESRDLAKKIHEMHDTKDPDGTYLWYVPRRWLDELKNGLTDLTKTVGKVRGSQRDIARSLDVKTDDD